jgi:DNA-binding response OmpR family regulator
MSTNYHIVVVDDEEIVRETVQEYLLRQGYSVSGASGGSGLRKIMAERAVDLAILDVNMPGEDGLTIARDLRKTGRIGIIMLTANSESVDKVVGLEVGADDYVCKPFDLRELLARVRAVLRRAATDEIPVATLSREIRVGRCLLNLDRRKLYSADGGEIAITAMEYDLLNTFVKHPNRVLSRDQLLDLAHSKEMEAFDRSIDTRITRLRQKIETEPSAPQAIRTVRGAGYIFVPAGEA